MLPIIFSPEADEDLEEAFEWYEVQSPGVEARFLEEIKSALEQISDHPKRFPVLHHPIRGAFLLKFQYTIYYELLDDPQVIYIWGIWHQARNPKVFRKRIQ
jgi:toxin ParE1/3/4